MVTDDLPPYLVKGTVENLPPYLVSIADSEKFTPLVQLELMEDCEILKVDKSNKTDWKKKGRDELEMSLTNYKKELIIDDQPRLNQTVMDQAEDINRLVSDLAKPENSNGLATIQHMLPGNPAYLLDLVTEVRKDFCGVFTRLCSSYAILGKFTSVLSSVQTGGSKEKLDTVSNELEWSIQLLDPSLDGDGCCAQLGSYHANSIELSAELPFLIFAAKSELEIEETLDAKLPLDNFCSAVSTLLKSFYGMPSS